MQKIIGLILCFFLLCGFTDPVKEYPTPISIAANVHGPRGLESFLSSFEFTRNGANNLKDFLKTKKGDCDMFALLCYYVLKCWDLEPIIVMVNRPDYNVKMRSHVICVFKTKGGVYLFNNGKLCFGEKTAKKLGNRIFKNWSSVVVYSMNRYQRLERYKIITSGSQDYTFYPEF